MLFYPFGIINDLLLRFESVFFLIVFWGLVSANNGAQKSFTYIIAYFFISRCINEFTMTSHLSVGNVIRKRIKTGALSQYILKPVNIIAHVYFELLGERGVVVFFNLIFFGIGLFLLGNVEIISIILFVINFVFAMTTSIAFNSLLSSYSMAITYKGDVKNVFNHISHLLSGALVPLSFFPDGIRQVLLFLPFQNMIYGPTNAFSIHQINNDVLVQLIVSGVWSLVLYFGSKYLWNKSLKKYEAVAI